MKKGVIIFIFVMIVAIIVSICFYFRFDNTTEKIVREDMTKVEILIDDKYINNSVKSKLLIENNNGFDINMIGMYCSNNDIRLDVQNEGTFVIENNDTLNYDFTIVFNEGIDSEDYLTLLENESILVSFSASAANQNDNITYVKSVVKAN